MYLKPINLELICILGRNTIAHHWMHTTRANKDIIKKTKFVIFFKQLIITSCRSIKIRNEKNTLFRNYLEGFVKYIIKSYDFVARYINKPTNSRTYKLSKLLRKATFYLLQKNVSYIEKKKPKSKRSLKEP